VSTLSNIFADLRKRRLVLLIDDGGRLGPVYLICAARTTSAENVSFMVNTGRGIICAAIAEARLKELGLPMMVSGASGQAPDFTVSVEARQGVSTGISAADRATTLRTLAETNHPKQDLVTPGHIFPLRAKDGGVLVRSGPAEAAVDLVQLAGLGPVATLCHCLGEEGAALTTRGIDELRTETGLSAVTISDVTRYRLASEPIVERIARATLPIGEVGEFQAFCFRSKTDGAEHLALVKGNLSLADSCGQQQPVLARVQAEHQIGDLLGTNNLFSRQRIHAALRQIDAAGRGVFIYVRHPRQGALQAQSATFASSSGSSVTSQLREHGIGAQILRSLGVSRVTLLTNSTRDIAGITAFQVEIVGRMAISGLNSGQRPNR
jgi:3,4-dihydroxy 2-butanone 4-phosphate synthase/GTP cyclohydrolase II